MYVLLIFAVVAVLAGICLCSKKSINRQIVYLISLTVVCFFCLRFHLGTDLSNYYYAFNRVSSPIADAFKYTAQRNIGFNMLLYYGKALLKKYPMFVLLVNILCFGLIGWTSYQHSRNLLFSLAVLVSGGVLEVYISSGIRQAISMSVFFFAFYTFLPKRKYGWYFCFALIALLFHEAAVFTLFIPLIAKLIPYIRRQWKTTIAITAGVVAAAFFLFYFILPAYAARIESMTASIPLRHILNYFEVTPSISLIGMAMELCFLAMTVLFWQLSDCDKKDDFELLQLLVIAFSVALYLGLSGIPIISRASDFLQITFLIFLPELLDQIPDTKRKLLCYVAVIAVHTVLLGVDLKEKCRHITLLNGETCTIETYPYFTVFDSQAGLYLEKS